MLRLDDFYKDGDDPTLPRITEGANAGIVDWDDPESWLLDDALAALEALCRDGRAEVPVYDIAHNGRHGTHVVDLGGHEVFVAEGIFAQEVVPACPAGPARRGVLRAPAPDGDLLAPAHPRPARAPQAAAGAGPPRAWR